VSQGGVPDRARWTPVPDLFFARYLVELADPVSLKVALFVLWRAHRRAPGTDPVLRETDLLADPAIRRGLCACGVPEPGLASALSSALDHLVARGWLIEGRAVGRDAPERWVWPNTRDGRAAHARWRSGEQALPAAPVAPPAGTAPRPSLFALFEENIGLLTPLLVEELREAEAAYPPGWIEDAIGQAVAHNARRWAYVRAILERWAREGRDDETDRRGARPDRGRDAEGPYADFIQH